MSTTVIHIGSNVLNKSKFHYIYSFDPQLERQRMGFQESGTKEGGILLVWNSLLCVRVDARESSLEFNNVKITPTRTRNVAMTSTFSGSGDVTDHVTVRLISCNMIRFYGRTTSNHLTQTSNNCQRQNKLLSINMKLNKRRCRPSDDRIRRRPPSYTLP